MNLHGIEMKAVCFLQFFSQIGFSFSHMQINDNNHDETTGAQ